MLDLLAFVPLLGPVSELIPAMKPLLNGMLYVSLGTTAVAMTVATRQELLAVEARYNATREPIERNLASATAAGDTQKGETLRKQLEDLKNRRDIMVAQVIGEAAVSGGLLLVQLGVSATHAAQKGTTAPIKSGPPEDLATTKPVRPPDEAHTAAVRGGTAAEASIPAETSANPEASTPSEGSVPAGGEVPAAAESQTTPKGNVRVGLGTKYRRASLEVSRARWKQLRADAIARDPTCPYCQVRESVTADHVEPLVEADVVADTGMMSLDEARAAANSPDNLRGICGPCNTAKAGRPLGDSKVDPSWWTPPNPDQSLIDYMRRMRRWPW